MLKYDDDVNETEFRMLKKKSYSKLELKTMRSNLNENLNNFSKK